MAAKKMSGPQAVVETANKARMARQSRLRKGERRRRAVKQEKGRRFGSIRGPWVACRQVYRVGMEAGRVRGNRFGAVIAVLSR